MPGSLARLELLALTKWVHIFLLDVACYCQPVDKMLLDGCFSSVLVVPLQRNVHGYLGARTI